MDFKYGIESSIKNQGLFIGFLISLLARVNGRISKFPQSAQYHWHFQPMFSQLDLDNGFDNIKDDILSLYLRKIKKINREIMKSDVTKIRPGSV